MNKKKFCKLHRRLLLLYKKLSSDSSRNRPVTLLIIHLYSTVVFAVVAVAVVAAVAVIRELTETVSESEVARKIKIKKKNYKFLNHFCKK